MKISLVIISDVYNNIKETDMFFNWLRGSNSLDDDQNDQNNSNDSNDQNDSDSEDNSNDSNDSDSEDNTLDIKDLEYIQYKLSLTEKFFVWLYFPFDILSIDDIFMFKKKYDIPDDIFIRKLILYKLYYQSSEDDIMKFVYDKKLLQNNETNKEKIRQLIDECKKEKLNKINSAIVDEIIKLSKNIKHKDITHNKYPLPDPELGRPRLGWLKCYHQNCGKYFLSSEELEKHLVKTGNYTWGFHLYHENVVNEMNLTPEKIIKDNMTRCPSIICDKYDTIFTPQELCMHFKLLGIKPFWKQGTVIKYSDEELYGDDDNLELSDKRIYAAKECLICMDALPMILFSPCYHNVVCMNCYNLITKCPICRKDIIGKIAY